MTLLSIYFVFSILVSKQFILLFTKITNYGSYLKNKKQIYPVIYLIRASFNFMFPFVASHTNFPYIYEILAFLGLIYLIIITLYRPYSSKIDNVAICMNELTLIFAASWIFMRDLPFYTEDIKNYFYMAMIGLLFLTVLLSIIRTLNGLKDKLCRKEVKN